MFFSSFLTLVCFNALLIIAERIPLHKRALACQRIERAGPQCGGVGFLTRPMLMRDGTSLPAASLEECALTCYQRAKCISFGFTGSTQMCYLYSQNTGDMRYGSASSSPFTYYNLNCYVCSQQAGVQTTTVNPTTRPSTTPAYASPTTASSHLTTSADLPPPPSKTTPPVTTPAYTASLPPPMQPTCAATTITETRTVTESGAVPSPVTITSPGPAPPAVTITSPGPAPPAVTITLPGPAPPAVTTTRVVSVTTSVTTTATVVAQNTALPYLVNGISWAYYDATNDIGATAAAWSAALYASRAPRAASYLTGALGFSFPSDSAVLSFSLYGFSGLPTTRFALSYSGFIQCYDNAIYQFATEYVDDKLAFWAGFNYGVRAWQMAVAPTVMSPANTMQGQTTAISNFQCALGQRIGFRYVYGQEMGVVSMKPVIKRNGVVVLSSTMQDYTHFFTSI